MRCTASTKATAGRRHRSLLATVTAFLSLTLVGAVFSSTAAAAPARPDDPSAAARTSVVVPVGVTAGVAVFDRQSGKFTTPGT
ncbi:hypothetical protein [Streptomyces torulosus]|uniref:hypothetical protein n=1 Tax=Streptomyces torulosus TaxID=68276 RepID=UPI00099E95CD|nr:hypothetical protein [Streptomyces torulosus]